MTIDCFHARKTVERSKEIRRRQAEDEAKASSTPEATFDWASLFDLEDDDENAPPEIVYGDDKAPSKSETKRRLKGLLKDLK